MPDDLFLRGGVMLLLGVVFLLACQYAFSRMESSFAERLVA
jgi:hypothetical protein